MFVSKVEPVESQAPPAGPNHDGSAAKEAAEAAEAAGWAKPSVARNLSMVFNFIRNSANLVLLTNFFSWASVSM